jgi:hypothetical protein
MSSPDDTGDKTAQVFMPLPPPAEDSRGHFSRDLAVLVDLLGADPGAEEPASTPSAPARSAPRTGRRRPGGGSGHPESAGEDGGPTKGQ